MRNLLRWLLGDPPSALPAASKDALALAVKRLEVQQHELDVLGAQLALDVKRLKSERVEREAEHAAQLDRLSRLYKRVSQRIAAEATTDEPRESPLELRRRLGR
jgi:hypothetical protein